MGELIGWVSFCPLSGVVSTNKPVTPSINPTIPANSKSLFHPCLSIIKLDNAQTELPIKIA